MQIKLPDLGLSPVPLIQSFMLYHVAIKVNLYRKAVQMCYIHITGVIFPINAEIRSWISRSPRITWNKIQGVLCTRGLYTVVSKCYMWKKKLITFSSTGDRTRPLDSKSYTPPCCHKSRLVPHDTRVLYTYTRWHLQKIIWTLLLHKKQCRTLLTAVH